MDEKTEVAISVEALKGLLGATLDWLTEHAAGSTASYLRKVQLSYKEGADAFAAFQWRALERKEIDASFDLWWEADGRTIDPDPGVPWFDKRKDLCWEAWKASRPATIADMMNKSKEAGKQKT